MESVRVASLVEVVAPKSNPNCPVRGFYVDTLQKLIAAGSIDPAAKTLVVCGGPLDAEVLGELGFTNTTISNLDAQMLIRDNRFEWAYQDTEDLTYDDCAFEQVIEHNGLHHCASPHRALTEMYRVASRAVLAFEPRDSLALRIAGALGLTRDHEVETVIDHGMTSGGLRNGPVPNYVYRWKEREVEKTLATFDPTGPIDHQFFHGLAIPSYAHLTGRQKFMLAAVTPVAKTLLALVPKEGNRFAFFAERPRERHSWVNEDLLILPEKATG